MGLPLILVKILFDPTDLEKYIYKPTKSLVEYTKKLGVPAICFPRGISDYSKFCRIVDPSMVNIDYNVNIENIVDHIKIPIQGGLDPKVLLKNKEEIEKEVRKYLDIFREQPYIFNLGHGVLPETKPEIIKFVTSLVRKYK